MVCKNCGADLKPGIKYCLNCGYYLDEDDDKTEQNDSLSDISDDVSSDNSDSTFDDFGEDLNEQKKSKRKKNDYDRYAYIWSINPNNCNFFYCYDCFFNKW